MAKKKNTPPTDSTDNGTVRLVQDPFAIQTLEVSEAQESSEPIDENVPELDAAEEAAAMIEQAIEKTEAEVLTASEATFEDQAESLESDELDDSEEEAELPELEGEEEISIIDPAQVRAEFESLASAVAEAESQHLEDARKLAQALADVEQESEQKLAREIAEEQALQAEMAKEAAEAEEAEKLDPEIEAALPNPLDLAEMQSAIESLLFISDKPMSLKKLHELLGAEDYKFSTLQEAVTAMKDRYAAPEFGIELVEVANGLQFRTKPGRAALARKLAKVQVQRLSGGAMETLAIIAYKQPVLKDEIDKIRGVDSSYFIRALLDRKLIHMSGRSDLPGKPILYGTTDDFLQLFGLKDLDAMPSLAELENMVPASQSKNPEDEDPRIKTLRKLVGAMNSDTSVSLLYDPREDEQILSDIRERVGSIATSTPYLDEQKAAEKAAKEAEKAAALAATEPAANLEEEMARQEAIHGAFESLASGETSATELAPMEVAPEILAGAAQDGNEAVDAEARPSDE